jgi:hypothetical protein
MKNLGLLITGFILGIIFCIIVTLVKVAPMDNVIRVGDCVSLSEITTIKIIDETEKMWKIEVITHFILPPGHQSTIPKEVMPFYDNNKIRRCV